MTIDVTFDTVDNHIPGDFRRNDEGKPWVKAADSNRKVIYNRPSDWPFESYAGVPDIYSRRGVWVHTLTETLDASPYFDTYPEAIILAPGYPVDPEFVDQGEALGIPLELQRTITKQYVAFREAHGLVARHVEVKVVNDTHRVAGTVDRIDEATHPIVTPFGTINPSDLVVCDIKTGSKIVKASYAAQLPMYADGVPYDVDTDTRGEW